MTVGELCTALGPMLAPAGSGAKGLPLIVLRTATATEPGAYPMMDLVGDTRYVVELSPSQPVPAVPANQPLELVLGSDPLDAGQQGGAGEGVEGGMDAYTGSGAGAGAGNPATIAMNKTLASTNILYVKVSSRWLHR